MDSFVSIEKGMGCWQSDCAILGIWYNWATRFGFLLECLRQLDRDEQEVRPCPIISPPLSRNTSPT